MIAIASAKLNVKIDNQFCGVGFRLHGRVVITAARLRHFFQLGCHCTSVAGSRDPSPAAETCICIYLGKKITFRP